MKHTTENLRVDTAAIRRMSDAATPGPWTTINPLCPPAKRGNLGPQYAVHDDDGVVIASAKAGPNNIDSAAAESDAAFIAAARTAVPALCDEVERLRAALTAPDDDKRLLGRLIEILREQIAGDEDAVEVLTRIIKERDAALTAPPAPPRVDVRRLCDEYQKLTPGGSTYRRAMADALRAAGCKVTE